MTDIYKLLFILIMVPALLGYPRRKRPMLPGKRWYHKKGLPKSAFDMLPLEVYSVADPVFLNLPSIPISGSGINFRSQGIGMLAPSFLESGSELISNSISRMIGNSEFSRPDDGQFPFDGENANVDQLSLVRILPAHARDTLSGNILNIDFVSASGQGIVDKTATTEIGGSTVTAITGKHETQLKDTTELLTKADQQLTSDVINFKNDVNKVEKSSLGNSVVIPLALQRQIHTDKISDNNLNALDYHLGIPIAFPSESNILAAQTNSSDVISHATKDSVSVSKARNPFGGLMDIQPFGRGPYADCKIPARVVCGARAGWSDVIGMDEWCSGNCVVFSYSSYCDDERCHCKCTEESKVPSTINLV